ncbi:MAG: hypothetical protein ABUS79_19230 [Pseudomonadota bacterium]
MKVAGIRWWIIWCAAMWGLGAVGCATVQPFVPSDGQRARFDQTIRAAQASAGDGPSQVATMLAEAKSEFEYSQHLPKYPERARAMADKAQRDAEAALRLAHTFVRPAPPTLPPPPPAIPVATAADGFSATE